MYYIYMLRCKGNSLYTGITVNLKNRMKEHFLKDKKGAKYTKAHNAEKLECVWETENKSLASKLEYHIKTLNKLKKEELIQKDNLEELLGEKIDYCNYKRVNIDKYKEI